MPFTEQQNEEFSNDLIFTKQTSFKGSQSFDNLVDAGSSFFKKQKLEEEDKFQKKPPCYDRGRFEQKAMDYLRDYQCPKRRSLSTLNDLFDGSFIIGEAHDDSAPKLFLIERFEALKNAGFTTLFMEHLYYDQQHLLDNCTDGGELPDKIKSTLQRLDSWHRVEGTNNFLNVVIAAINAGLRVVALEIKQVCDDQRVNQEGEQLDTFRHPSFSYTALNIIQRECEGDDKWVGLMGNTHLNTWNNIPGVAELTGARSVYIFDLNVDRLSIQLNINEECGLGLLPAHVRINVPQGCTDLSELAIKDLSIDMHSLT